MPRSATAINVLVFERDGARFAVATRHVVGVGERGGVMALPATSPPFVGVVRHAEAYALAVDPAEERRDDVRAWLPVFARRDGGWLLALLADRIVGVANLELDTVVHPALVAGRGDLDLFHAVSMDPAGITLILNLAAIEARATLEPLEAPA